MAKFRPRGGSRLPSRSGGSTGGQLKSNVDGVTAALQTQRQAWTEVISSLNEYRSIELPDFSLSVPDVAAWQTLTAEVKAYSAAVSAIPAPTVATFAPSDASSPATTTTADPSSQIAALNAIDSEIDDQATHWAALSAQVSTSLAAADSSIDQHKEHWLNVSQSISDAVSEITATMSELANVPAPEVTAGGEATTDSIDDQTNALKELATATASAAESTAASAAAMRELLTSATQTQSGLEGVNREIASATPASREQMQQLISTIHTQDQSWRSLAVTTVGALGHITTSVIGLLSASRTLATAQLTARTAQIQLTTATIAGATANTAAIAPTFTLAAAVNFLLSPIVLVTAAIAAVAAVIYSLTASENEATAATNDTAAAADSAASSYSLWEAATTKLGLATEKLTGELNAVEIQKQSLSGPLFDEETLTSLGKLATGIEQVKASYANLKATIEQPFIDAKNAFVSYGLALLGIKDSADTASNLLKPVADAIDQLTDAAKGGIHDVEAFLYQLRTGASDEEAEAFVKQGEAMSELSLRAARATAAMEAQREVFKRLAQTQQEATDSAKASTEAARIGRISTIAEIEKEERALQDKAGAEIRAGQAAVDALRKRGATAAEIKAQEKANKSQESNTAESIRNVANQREKIETGQVKPIGTDQIEAAQRAVLSLTLGQDEAALAALRAKGASEKEVEALRELQHQINGINQAREIEKLAIAARNKSLQEAQAIDQKVTETTNGLKDKIDVLSGSATQAEIAMRELARQGIDQESISKIADLNAEVAKLTTAQKAADKITSIKDQIDLLNGSATAAQIAMRELGREGFSDEQIAQIGALTGELDRLKESKKKKGEQDKDTAPPVAFAGSKEAAEIALRGVGSGNRMESIANQQLQVQREIARGVSRPPAPAVGVPTLPQTVSLPPDKDFATGDTSLGGQRPLSFLPPPLVPPRIPAPSPPDVRAEAPVLIPERAGLNETPKISGVSERVTEPRRNERDNEMVDLLRLQLSEARLTTAAIKEKQSVEIQMGSV